MFKKILLTLLFLGLSLPAYAVSTLSPGVGYDYVGTSAIKLNGTNTFMYAYINSTEHGGNDTTDKHVGVTWECASATDCSTITNKRYFTIYTDDTYLTSITGIWQRPTDNRIFVWVKRRPDTTSKDWGYVYSDDNGRTWSDLQIKFTFSAGTPEYRVFSQNGPVCRTDTPGEYFLAAGGNDNPATTYKVTLIHTTDSFDTVAYDEVEIYSGATLLREPSCLYLGNGTLVVLVRNSSGGTLGMSRSTDNGVTWSAMATTNIGGTSTNVVGTYNDEAYDDAVVMTFDRQVSGGGATAGSYYFTTSTHAASKYTTVWPALIPIQIGVYLEQGQSGGIRLDDNHLMVLWSNELTSSRADIVYEILTIGTTNQHLEFE